MNNNQMQVLETAIASDKGRRIAGQVGLDVMKQLITAKSHQRVLVVYRLLRVRGYIGRGNQNRARVTTMATCYGARAAEVGRGKSLPRAIWALHINVCVVVVVCFRPIFIRASVCPSAFDGDLHTRFGVIVVVSYGTRFDACCGTTRRIRPGGVTQQEGVNMCGRGSFFLCSPSCVLSLSSDGWTLTGCSSSVAREIESTGREPGAVSPPAPPYVVVQ